MKEAAGQCCMDFSIRVAWVVLMGERIGGRDEERIGPIIAVMDSASTGPATGDREIRKGFGRGLQGFKVADSDARFSPTIDPEQRLCNGAQERLVDGHLNGRRARLEIFDELKKNEGLRHGGLIHASGVKMSAWVGWMDAPESTNRRSNGDLNGWSAGPHFGDPFAMDHG